MQENVGSPLSCPRGAAMTQGEGTDMDKEMGPGRAVQIKGTFGKGGTEELSLAECSDMDRWEI